MKKVLIALGFVLLLVSGGAFYLWQTLGPRVQAAVQEVGGRTTGVPVTLEEADASGLLGGDLVLHGLVIANPPGFKTDSVLKVEQIRMNIDLPSVLSDTVVVNELVISSPEVSYEFARGTSNIGTIQQNVKAGRSTGGGAPSDGGAKKVVIENVYVRDGSVNASADFLQGRAVGTALPALHLTGVGKDSGGKLPRQAAEQILAAIALGATEAVAKLNVGPINQALSKQAGDLQKAVEASGLEALGRAPGDAGKALKGILGQ
jgi:hypothetical protein